LSASVRPDTDCPSILIANTVLLGCETRHGRVSADDDFENDSERDMGLKYDHLDEITRGYMLEEIESDSAGGQMYFSPRLHEAGCESWPDLLRDAARTGSDDSLAEAIRFNDCLQTHLPRAKPKGGFTMAAVPVNAPETLAEGEFNRFYLRGLCRRAISDGIPCLIAYRAKAVENARSASEALIGKQFDPAKVLDDLRTSQGVDTALGLPPGPNSGMCLRLP